MKNMNAIKTLKPLTRAFITSLMCSLPLLGVSSVHATTVSAPLKVTLSPSDPTWQLAINNKLLGPTEVLIEPTERGFARQVQPLLQAGNYSEVAALFKNRDMNQDSTALNLLRAQVLLSIKDFDKAEAAYLACLKASPSLIQAHQGLSLLYMQQANYNKAQTHLVRTIELGQADAQSYAQLAYIHVQHSQPWSAVAAYRQALMLAPETSQYQQGLLFALIESGDLNQANALLKELLNKNPDNAELWLQRAQIALQLEQNKNALAAIEVALKLNPKDTSNQLLAAQLHLSQGSSERAVTLLKQGLKHAGKKQQTAVINTTMQTLGWLVSQQQWGLAKELINSAKRFTKQLPRDEQAQFSVYNAQLAIQQGNTNGAIKSLNSALKINPNLGDALLSLASIYRNKNQLTQAKLMYVRAQALPDYQLSAWLGLSQVAIDSKDYPDALKHLKKALQANPQRQDLITNIRALENIVRQKG